MLTAEGRQSPGLSLWQLLLAARHWRPVLMATASGPWYPSILRLRLGDPREQERYVAYFWPYLQSEVQRYARIGGPEEELQAEGALALWEAAFQYAPSRHRTDLPDYVRNHIHRRVRQAYRKARGYQGEKVVPLTRLAELPDHRTDLSDAEQRLDLKAAQARLEPADHQTWGLYQRLAVSGLGPDQASQRLARDHGGTPAAWKKRIQRTRQKLRQWCDSRE